MSWMSEMSWAEEVRAPRHRRLATGGEKRREAARSGEKRREADRRTSKKKGGTALRHRFFVFSWTSPLRFRGIQPWVRSPLPLAAYFLTQNFLAFLSEWVGRKVGKLSTANVSTCLILGSTHVDILPDHLHALQISSFLPNVTYSSEGRHRTPKLAASLLDELMPPQVIGVVTVKS